MSTALAIVRYTATIALAALTAVYTYYPRLTWIPISIAVIGTLGIHIIPASPGIQAKQTPTLPTLVPTVQMSVTPPSATATATQTEPPHAT
jgi:hypothetical protein